MCKYRPRSSLWTKIERPSIKKSTTISTTGPHAWPIAIFRFISAHHFLYHQLYISYSPHGCHGDKSPPESFPHAKKERARKVVGISRLVLKGMKISKAFIKKAFYGK